MIKAIVTVYLVGEEPKVELMLPQVPARQDQLFVTVGDAPHRLVRVQQVTYWCDGNNVFTHVEIDAAPV